MKKTLIALAAVAVSSAAMAQVTVSGAIAAGQSKDGTARAITSMEVAELRFSASEDLGGGLRASGFFVIENMNKRGRTATAQTTGVDAGGGGTTASTSAFNTNGATNADSGLSLSGGFGEIKFDNTRSSNMAASANVFGASIGKGFYDTVASRPNVQVVSYTSPELVKGLRVAVAQAAVGDAATSQASKINIIGATYAAGPLSLGVQQKSFNTSAKAIVANTEEKQTEAFARYNAGVALIGLGYGSKTTTTGKAMTSYGISIPLGAITLGYEGAKRDAAEFTQYGARYALSKRTTVHVSSGKYQTTATDSKNQSRVRLSHSF